MQELHPFLLRPQFVERVWGARDLAPIFEKKLRQDEPPVGEVWLTGDDCRAADGKEHDLTLAELAKKYGRALVGEAAPHAHRFPLLVKFLFPCEKLSVQVHPDDEHARSTGLECGKTECWYVLAAKRGAQIGLGLKHGTTRTMLRKAIDEARAEQLLNWIEIHPGDLIYVDAGTVHAIGPGSVIVETQQNSDTTYRLYDYGRPRELHIEKGLAATREKTRAGKVQPQFSHPTAADGNVNLITSPCFVVNKRALAKGKEHVITRHMPPTSVQILVGLHGGGSVHAKHAEAVNFHRGEAVVVPAATTEFSVRPYENMEYLHISLPHDAAEHPKTVLA